MTISPAPIFSETAAPDPADSGTAAPGTAVPGAAASGPTASGTATSGIAPTSRRELNKAATREAIAGATLEFLRSKSLNEFTVDDVAGAAGISRRTFFNYFSSVEAAVASFTENYLDAVIAELESRPGDEPILESAQYALSSASSASGLATLAETFALTQDPQLARFQLQAWDECSVKIADVARNRLPATTDELYIQAMVGAVVGSCKAAFGVWFQQHGTNTSPSSVAHLRELLGATISLVRNGFTN